MKTLQIETDLSDIPDSTLKKLNVLLCKEFSKPYRKYKYIETSCGWKILLSLQFELERRKKK